jgi:type VI secretion system protein ImpH
VRYFALLTNESRPADGLERLISDYFAVPGVKVRQFLPHRFKLRSHERSLLGDSGANQQLGGSLILGDRVLDRAGQFRLSLGPLDRDGFLKLQPGEPDFAELVFLVKLYVRNQLDFELELILDSQQVEPLRLSHQQQRHTLGRYSWLSQPKAETVRTVIHTETEQNGGGKC